MPSKSVHLLGSFVSSASRVMVNSGNKYLMQSLVISNGFPRKLETWYALNGKYLKEAVDFHVEDYPGYTNRRGQGANCGGTFHLGPCKTYKFISRYFIPSMSSSWVVSGFNL